MGRVRQAAKLKLNDSKPSGPATGYAIVSRQQSVMLKKCTTVRVKMHNRPGECALERET